MLHRQLEPGADVIEKYEIAGAIRRVQYPCRDLCPTEGATEAGHVQSQDLVKNRILRQLSADELKSVQPWLTLVELRSNAVLH
jgi:hypothetical protein